MKAKVPSGYSKDLNGTKDKEGNDYINYDGKHGKEVDSDWVTLENDGIRQVVPGMKNHWYWSSSVSSNDSYFAYYFYGNYGVIDVDFRNDSYGSVLCLRWG